MCRDLGRHKDLVLDELMGIYELKVCIQIYSSSRHPTAGSHQATGCLEALDPNQVNAYLIINRNEYLIKFRKQINALYFPFDWNIESFHETN